MEFCDLQVKRFPERFVLNPLDADDVEASHGFTEQSLDLLKFIRRVLQGDPLETRSNIYSVEQWMEHSFILKA